MPDLDPDRLLALLRDPHTESLEIAKLAGVPREEAGRASRLLAQLTRAKPDEVASLPGPLAAALGRAAASAGRADVLAALAGHAAKEVAKEAKRGLHLLRTRGVQVPELPAPATPAPAPAPAEPPPPGLASAPDGHGERGLWLLRPVPGKGYEIAQAVVSDVLGLVELSVGVLSKKEWRAFAAGLKERGAGMAICELPAGRVQALLQAARALNDASGQRLPEGADLWLSRLGPAPAAPEEPPRPALAPLPPDEEARALAASGDLHATPMFRGWLADEAHLRAVAARLDEVAVSQLYVDERQRAEQADRIVAEAAEAWLESGRSRAARLAPRGRGRAPRPHGRRGARRGRRRRRAGGGGGPARGGRPVPPGARREGLPGPSPEGPGAAPGRIDPGITLR
ncbi:MAG: hypothetical protein QM704_24745 [Anaeromyxobacteraceae bacterium]